MHRVVSFVRYHHRKIQEIGVGIFIYETFSNIYDFVFYPFAIAYWGVLQGGAIATVLALILNAAVFWLYDYMRVDWLGAHALRELEKEEDRSSFAKMATWIGKEKTTWWEKIMHPVVFIGLLLPIDPVIVAIHYQRQHFNGITWRDWRLLILATVVANAWWILKVGVVVEGVKYIWNALY